MKWNFAKDEPLFLRNSHSYCDKKRRNNWQNGVHIMNYTEF